MSEMVLVLITDLSKRGYEKKFDEIRSTLDKIGFQYLGYDDRDIEGKKLRIHQFKYDTCKTYIDEDTNMPKPVTVDGKVAGIFIASGIVVDFFSVDTSCKMDLTKMAKAENEKVNPKLNIQKEEEEEEPVEFFG